MAYPLNYYIPGVTDSYLMISGKLIHQNADGTYPAADADMERRMALLGGAPFYDRPIRDANGNLTGFYNKDGSVATIAGGGVGGIVETIASSPYTFSEADKGKTKRWAGVGTLTITTPAGLSISSTNGNWWAKVYKEVGSGNITFAGDGTAAPVSLTGTLIMTQDKGEVLVEQIVTNVFKLSGDLGTLAAADIYAAALALFANGTNTTVSGDGTTIRINSTASGSSASFADTGNWYYANQYYGSATMTANGTLSFTVRGTVTAQSGDWNNTGRFNRVRNTSAAAANSSADFVSATPHGIFVGATAGGAHNKAKIVWACGDSTAATRCYVGFKASTPSQTVEPSTYTDYCGYGWDTTSTNTCYYCNDNVGSSTPVDLGANFPRDDPTVVYEQTIDEAPGGAAVRGVTLTLKNLKNGATHSVTITADLPTAGSNCNVVAGRNTSAGTAAVAFDFGIALGMGYSGI